MQKVSVIIAVYNAKAYLPFCLDSVLCQTALKENTIDLELICINDGSPDDCLEILQAYAKKDPRIHILNQENKGQSVARNKGLECAKGDYLLFLDSDDALPDYALKTMLNIAEKSNADVVVCDKMQRDFLFTPAPENIPYTLHKTPFKDFVSSSKIFSSACNKLYKKEAIKNHRFLEGICFEDWVFVTKLFSTISSYVSFSVPCYFYRQNQTSTIQTRFSEYKINSYMIGVKEVFSFFKNTKNASLAQKRILVALKMCINKVYKQKDKHLNTVLKTELKKLREEKVFYWHQLPLKSCFRLWRMK